MDLDKHFYKTICRVCLCCSKKENMVSLLNSEGNGELTCYGVAVTTFANIVIQSDNLPNMMCRRCLFMLKQAITFKKICESSDEKLMRLVQKAHHSAEETREKITQYVMFSSHFADADLSHHHKSENIQNNVDDTKESVEECKKVIKTENILIEITRNDSEHGMSEQDDSSSSDDQDSFQDNQVMGNQKKSKTVTDLRLEDIKEDVLLDEMENMLKLDCKFINSQLKRYPVKPKPHQSMQRSSVLTRKQKGEKIKSYSCEICDKVLANLDTYKRHKQVHTGYTFICEQCGKSFATNDILLSHLARIHSYGRFYECKECGYKAYRKWDLDEHQRLHTGERPFTCEKCGMRFRRQYLWKKHMKYHNEKSVQCPKCPRKFHMRGEMHAHYNNVHDRWYVYSCHMCNLTYAKTDSVRKHLLEKHGVAKEKQGRINRVVIGAMPVSTKSSS